MRFFFNERKPRAFRHDPIYWNPEKEALENRVKKVKREMGELDEKDYNPQDIKGSMIDQTQHVRRRQDNPQKSDSSRNIKLGIILVILAIGFYYYYMR